MQTEPPERSFLKGNDVYCSYRDAAAVLLQVPYEGTASYGKGTAAGPEAIISASEFLEAYDIPLGRKPSDIGIATLPAQPCDGPPEDVIRRVEELAAAVLTDGKKPVLIGGEHSVTLGAVRAALGKQPGLGVLQLDAHADLRDTYEGTPFSHACVMRRITELGAPHVGVGIRSMSEPEAQFAEARGIALLPTSSAAECGGGPLDSARGRPPLSRALADAVGNLPDKVYVTVDIDVLDPACMPATGAPEPGGLTWEQLVQVLQLLADSGKKIVGFDVVELAPIPGLHFCEYTAAKLIHRMIGMFWK